MFNKLFRRNTQTVPVVNLDQLNLDILRTAFADDQRMQLHCDRMQTALNVSRAR